MTRVKLFRKIVVILFLLFIFTSAPLIYASGTLIGSMGSSSSLTNPEGIITLPNGNILVTDINNKMVVFNSSGNLIGNFSSQIVYSPGYPAMDSSNNIYVPSSNTGTIAEFSDTGSYLISFGSASSGAGVCQLEDPVAVAINSSGDIFVAQTSGGSAGTGNIVEFNSSFGCMTAFSVSSPVDLAISTAGNLYIDSLNNQVLEYNSSNSLIASWGTTGNGNGQFNFPAGLTIAPNGDILVVDVANDRVEIFNASGTFLDSANLSIPTGSTLRGIEVNSANGEIYIADPSSHNVLEYIDPAFIPSTIDFPNSPANLGPSSSINNSWTLNTQPSFSFNLSDAQTANQVGYELQLSNTSNFLNPVLDYSSALQSQGSASFTLGQVAGGGVYNTGSSTVSLTSGAYYWQVKAINSYGTTSAFVQASSGNPAFNFDGTAPTIPGAPTSSSLATDSTPTLSWIASTDSVGPGLASNPYQMEWSSSPTFSNNVSSAYVSQNSFTVSSPLALGNWYFRVRALDSLGLTSGWSNTSSFSIEAPVVPPVAGNSSTSSNSNLTNPKTNINLQIINNSNLLNTTAVGAPTTSNSSSNSPNIFLNNYPNYVSGEGQNLALSNGQVITFEVLNIIHSLSVNKISSDSITFTLRSSPKQESLNIGQTGSYDVAGQSQNNIKIKLDSITKNQASLTFSALKYPVKIVSNVDNNRSSASSYYIPIIVILVLASFLVWYLRRAKQKSNIKN